MRRLFLLVYLFAIAGCVQQLSTNLEHSNELMSQNLQLMTESKQAIEANTREITRSTNAIQEMQFVFPIFIGIVALILVFILCKFVYKLFKK